MLSERGTLLTLATLDPAYQPVWHGLWIAGGTVRPLGPPVPPSAPGGGTPPAPPTGLLLDLLGAAYRSYIERAEELGVRLDELEARADRLPAAELATLVRRLGVLRKHAARLSVLVAELSGPLARAFPALDTALEAVRRQVTWVSELTANLAQGARDLTGLHHATEANRLAEAANQLARGSTRIAALANTSNLRMLGVGYVALLLALVSAVVLIPNTAATILGMPSAAWVPGLWVDATLAALAAVPVAVVFTRPWVRRMLTGWREYEARTSEGLADLPEVSPEVAARADASERLIREGP